MKTIIMGLGNPGEKFNNTRHNAGFMAIDFFAKKNNFSDFKLSKKHNSLVSENESVTLVKPQTFMNESGIAISNFKFQIRAQAPSSTNLVVVHDDIDMPLGKIKFSKDSGPGGHKGVESIINLLGTKDFVRLKIGICPLQGKPKAVEKFVLKKFATEEQEILHSVIEKSVQALEYFLEHGLEKTMNKYN